MLSNTFISVRGAGEDDLTNWGSHCEDFLLMILTGEYDLAEAREDILSFRKKKEEEDEEE